MCDQVEIDVQILIFLMFFLITELCLLVDIDFDDPEEDVE